MSIKLKPLTNLILMVMGYVALRAVFSLYSTILIAGAIGMLVQIPRFIYFVIVVAKFPRIPGTPGHAP